MLKKIPSTDARLSDADIAITTIAGYNSGVSDDCIVTAEAYEAAAERLAAGQVVEFDSIERLLIQTAMSPTPTETPFHEIGSDSEVRFVRFQLAKEAATLILKTHRGTPAKS